LEEATAAEGEGEARGLAGGLIDRTAALTEEEAAAAEEEGIGVSDCERRRRVYVVAGVCEGSGLSVVLAVGFGLLVLGAAV